MSEIQPEEIPNRVTGYRAQTEEKVEAVNQSKELERTIAGFWHSIRADTHLAADPRQMAMARTHFEDAFMHLNRAIFQPEDPFA
jgi:hypothetical protein